MYLKQITLAESYLQKITQKIRGNPKDSTKDNTKIRDNPKDNYKDNLKDKMPIPEKITLIYKDDISTIEYKLNKQLIPFRILFQEKLFILFFVIFC